MCIKIGVVFINEFVYHNGLVTYYIIPHLHKPLFCL